MTLSVSDFLPPVIQKARDRVTSLRKRELLFRGDSAMFVGIAPTCKVYGEYGMGASTHWMLRNTAAEVISVDTSNEWMNSVKTEHPKSNRLRATWVDVGPVGDWGRPVSYSHRNNFSIYQRSVWGHRSKPDLVLVDGRFRVACFLHSLLEASPGTRIIFDDYSSRGHFHVVEELVPRQEVCGEQCLFIVPDRINRDDVAELAGKFEFVMD